MDKTDKELAAPFMALFRGLERAHGTYSSDTIAEAGEKQKVKYLTIAKPYTIEHWERHLAGEARIGIVPINDDFKCWFGAIDIDQYDLDVQQKARDIYALGLPLCVCRSKSGGLHAYLFMAEPISAELVQLRLSEWSALIGHPINRKENEVFPKQKMLYKDRGDTGNWINMPYFGGHNTSNYCLGLDGLPLEPLDFLAFAESRKVTSDFLSVSVVKQDEWFADGPPCLSTIVQRGIDDGMRNVTMFAIAIYLYRRDKETWIKELHRYNTQFCKPPLEHEEVEAVADSVARKASYTYSCSQVPLSTYCSRGRCQNRKYGVAAVTGNITIKNLSKYESDPPIWWADTDSGHRIQLDTEDLQDQRRFQRRLMESTNTMPAPLKAVAWRESIAQLLETVQINQAPAEATTEGRLWNYIEEVCTAGRKAMIRDDILRDKVWTEGGFHYFTLKAITKQLERERNKEFKPNQIAHIITSRKGRSETVNLKDRPCSIFVLPEFRVVKERITTPDVRPKEVI